MLLYYCSSAQKTRDKIARCQDLSMAYWEYPPAKICCRKSKVVIDV